MPLRMPAEWEPHEGTWLAWPHETTDWPGKFAPIPWVYCEIIKHLSHVERVHILVESADAREKARRLLSKYPVNPAAVDFLLCPTDRSWARDYCPTFVKDGSGVKLLNWNFNGWAKYPAWRNDNAVSSKVARHLRLPELRPGAVLEGGGIDVNGEGKLLTTEEWLLSGVQVRNPGFTRQRYESLFQDYLGANETIWLKHGIAGDDTHGHIDDLARFTSPNVIALAVEQEKGETNYAPLQENLAILRKRPDLKTVPLPLPSPVFFAGQRLPASYANFYIANEMVLVPVFNDPNDRVALNILARLFPSRRIVPIYCGDLVLGLGTLHCMTQQQIA